MTVEIICADVREALARFPDGHFHCCVTSPPFWGLRDYGLEPTVWGDLKVACKHEWGETLTQYQRGKVGSESTLEGGSQRPESGDGEQHVPQGAFCRRCNAWRGTLGLEPTPELYVEHLVAVMREVRRVLRNDGTLWLNLGDSYNAAGRDGHGMRIGYKQGTNRASASGADSNRPTAPALKPKDLVGVPWMVAFALRADGWWLRSDIVWSKPNPMPESVRDRPTRSHEYLFLLTKRERYYYDQDAIREPHGDTRPSKAGDNYFSGQAAAPRPRGRGGPEHHFHEAGRNRRSVWEIATQPFPGAHFAVFPEKLVEPCILTTSERGCCPECGAPWERVVETRYQPVKYPGGIETPVGEPVAAHKHEPKASIYGNSPQAWSQGRARRINNTTGWRPTCAHGAEPVPCRVLDPFAGSGTVGLVAERVGRHSVLIDAKEEYCEMARHRTAQRGLMAEATE